MREKHENKINGGIIGLIEAIMRMLLVIDNRLYSYCRNLNYHTQLTLHIEVGVDMCEHTSNGCWVAKVSSAHGQEQIVTRVKTKQESPLLCQ